MNTYYITWFWPEESDLLESGEIFVGCLDDLRSSLKNDARNLFDCNPGIKTLKASVVNFKDNECFVSLFEKKPVTEYEILTTEY